jgi:sugar-specific transcriptional regulator TrmB
MNEELITQIEDLGLSEKESRVYVANLMLGPATVQRIADQATIKRVTAYVILESLAALGLVSQTNQGKKTYFTAEDPISLRRLLDKKQEQLKDQRKSFDSLLPDLQSLKNLPTESPTVKFYDGVEGIKSIFTSYFAANYKEDDTVYGISDLDQLHAMFPDIEGNSANPERVKHGVKSKYLYTSSRGPIYKVSDTQALRESRFLPREVFPFKGDISINNGHVIMLTLTGGKPIGVLIESQELADSMLALFNMAWVAAEQYQS